MTRIFTKKKDVRSTQETRKNSKKKGKDELFSNKAPEVVEDEEEVISISGVAKIGPAR